MSSKKVKIVHQIPKSNIVINMWNPNVNDKLIRFLTMIRFGSPLKIKHMKEANYTIYTSVFNQWYLTKYLKIPKNRIVTLEYNEPKEIYDENKEESFTVTAIDSNYCAGSTMLLFQGSFGNILYTGFFRPSISQNIFELPVLKEIIEQKNMDIVFIDNTYAAECCTFPKRSEVIAEIINLLKKYPDDKFIISGKRFGKEEVLYDIASVLHEKVCVSQSKFELVKEIGLKEFFTINPMESRIIVVDSILNLNQCCKRMLEHDACKIIILTAYYHCKQQYSKLPDQISNVKGLYIIPYSGHCNHSELMQFLSVIQPREIRPILHQKADLSPCSIIPTCMHDLCYKPNADTLKQKSESVFFTCEDVTDSQMLQNDGETKLDNEGISVDNSPTLGGCHINNNNKSLSMNKVTLPSVSPNISDTISSVERFYSDDKVTKFGMRDKLNESDRRKSAVSLFEVPAVENVMTVDNSTLDVISTMCIIDEQDCNLLTNNINNNPENLLTNENNLFDLNESEKNLDVSITEYHVSETNTQNGFLLGEDSLCTNYQPFYEKNVHTVNESAVNDEAELDFYSIENMNTNAMDNNKENPNLPNNFEIGDHNTITSKNKELNEQLNTDICAMDCDEEIFITSEYICIQDSDHQSNSNPFQADFSDRNNLRNEIDSMPRFNFFSTDPDRNLSGHKTDCGSSGIVDDFNICGDNSFHRINKKIFTIKSQLSHSQGNINQLTSNFKKIDAVKPINANTYTIVKQSSVTDICSSHSKHYSTDSYYADESEFVESENVGTIIENNYTVNKSLSNLGRNSKLSETNNTEEYYADESESAEHDIKKSNQSETYLKDNSKEQVSVNTSRMHEGNIIYDISTNNTGVTEEPLSDIDENTNSLDSNLIYETNFRKNADKNVIAENTNGVENQLSRKPTEKIIIEPESSNNNASSTHNINLFKIKSICFNKIQKNSRKLTDFSKKLNIFVPNENNTERYSDDLTYCDFIYTSRQNVYNYRSDRSDLQKETEDFTKNNSPNILKSRMSHCYGECLQNKNGEGDQLVVNECRQLKVNRRLNLVFKNILKDTEIDSCIVHSTTLQNASDNQIISDSIEIVPDSDHITQVSDVEKEDKNIEINFNLVSSTVHECIDDIRIIPDSDEMVPKKEKRITSTVENSNENIEIENSIVDSFFQEQIKNINTCRVVESDENFTIYFTPDELIEKNCESNDGNSKRNLNTPPKKKRKLSVFKRRISLKNNRCARQNNATPLINNLLYHYALIGEFDPSLTLDFWKDLNWHVARTHPIYKTF